MRGWLRVQILSIRITSKQAELGVSKSAIDFLIFWAIVFLKSHTVVVAQ